MTRLHYTSRTGSTRRSGVAYRGVTTVRRQATTVIIPVTGDLIECPVCHGGVATVGAPFGDSEQGITYGKTRVYASHQRGGKPGQGRDKCPGSHAKVVS